MPRDLKYISKLLIASLIYSTKSTTRLLSRIWTHPFHSGDIMNSINSNNSPHGYEQSCSLLVEI
jgi:hypothetical protein